MKLKIFTVISAILTVLALLLAAAVGLLWWNNGQVTLSLTGSADWYVEYGGAYQEPGAVGTYSDKLFAREGKDLPVTITGQVDTSRLGTYELTYSVSYQNVTATANRTVIVRDTLAPTITLTDTTATTLPGERYEEEGFTALDLHDGDVTDQVERREENGVVYYTVTDSSGNRAEITRAISYYDPEPPVLTLKGEEKITLTVGDTYEEPGWTATDNVDGDLTESVTFSFRPRLNTKKAGTYRIRYSVTDEFGNLTWASRVIVVEKAEEN